MKGVDAFIFYLYRYNFTLTGTCVYDNCGSIKTKLELLRFVVYSLWSKKFVIHVKV